MRVTPPAFRRHPGQPDWNNGITGFRQFRPSAYSGHEKTPGVSRGLIHLLSSGCEVMAPLADGFQLLGEPVPHESNPLGGSALDALGLARPVLGPVVIRCVNRERPDRAGLAVSKCVRHV